MDDIVKAAMAKWPDVPDCYGWLALDARGNWRMRDARCQALESAGRHHPPSKLVKLYQSELSARRQRPMVLPEWPAASVCGSGGDTVYRPHFRCRIYSAYREILPQPDAGFFNSEGNLILQSNKILAQLDDRDLAEVSSQLYENNQLLDDNDLMDWLNQTNQADCNDNWFGVFTEKVTVRFPLQKMNSQT
jgi:hypothetical protein